MDNKIGGDALGDDDVNVLRTASPAFSPNRNKSAETDSKAIYGKNQILIYIGTYACVLCVCVCVCVCVHVCMHASECVCMCTCAHVCMSMCECVHMCWCTIILCLRLYMH